MITVLFFAQIRELIGQDRLVIDASMITVEALRQQLAAQGDNWALAFDEGQLLTAVNHQLVDKTHIIADGDEVAFYPPVTGG